MTRDELKQLPTGTAVTFVGESCRKGMTVHLRHDVTTLAWYNQGLQAVSKRPGGPHFFCAPYESLSAQA